MHEITRPTLLLVPKKGGWCEWGKGGRHSLSGVCGWMSRKVGMMGWGFDIRFIRG